MSQVAVGLLRPVPARKLRAYLANGSWFVIVVHMLPTAMPVLTLARNMMGCTVKSTLIVVDGCEPLYGTPSRVTLSDVELFRILERHG